MFIGYASERCEKLVWLCFDSGYGGYENPPSEIHVTRSRSQEVQILQRNIECVVPCRTGEISQEGQRLSAAVYKAQQYFRQYSQPNFSKEQEARDTDPDVEDVLHEATINDNWTLGGDTSLSEP